MADKYAKLSSTLITNKPGLCRTVLFPDPYPWKRLASYFKENTEPECFIVMFNITVGFYKKLTQNQISKRKNMPS
jgi:hypothetical protein